jgi:hypothetical protein
VQQAVENEDDQHNVGEKRLGKRYQNRSAGGHALFLEHHHAQGKAAQAARWQNIVGGIGDKGNAQHVSLTNVRARSSRDAFVRKRHREVAQECGNKRKRK